MNASIRRSAAPAVHQARHASTVPARSDNVPTRSAKLRAMLQSPQLEFLMEAHNGLSARIVREAGFGGIWASGLSISAQFGVGENNQAGRSQVVGWLKVMAEARRLPLLLDWGS